MTSYQKSYRVAIPLNTPGFPEFFFKEILPICADFSHFALPGMGSLPPLFASEATEEEVNLRLKESSLSCTHPYKCVLLDNRTAMWKIVHADSVGSNPVLYPTCRVAQELLDWWLDGSGKSPSGWAERKKREDAQETASQELKSSKLPTLGTSGATPNGPVRKPGQVISRPDSADILGNELTDSSQDKVTRPGVLRKGASGQSNPGFRSSLEDADWEVVGEEATDESDYVCVDKDSLPLTQSR